MNAQNIDNKPTVKKNTKNKIRVEFERAPLKERLKAKFLSMYFVKKVVWYIFRLVLLIGVSYIVLVPFFERISGSFKLPDDFVDATVRLIPRKFSTDTYSAIWKENSYFEGFTHTLFLSGMCAILQTFICCFIAYGLAKFKFKGRNLIFLAVIFTLAVPHKPLEYSMTQSFANFDILGIFKFLNGGGWEIFGKTIIKSSPDLIPSGTGFWSNINEGGSISLKNTYWPFVILSLGGLAFKNGLYIFMLRQFFKGVPDELEESAYIDGSGIMRTFFTIIIPLSVPMMITVFIFAFSWQWTDTFYTGMFVPNSKDIEGMWLLTDTQRIPTSISSEYTIHPGYEAGFSGAVKDTAGLMIIAPLIVMYLFCQRYLVQGIERSGLTAD